MLPLHQGRSGKGEGKMGGMGHFLRPRVLLSTVQTFVTTIVRNRATRNVFFFLLLNLSFTFVEISYGIWTNSLGLIGDGVHMLFDSSALIGSLIASVIATWPPNDRFTYGYGRVETMTGFVNTLLLVYAALSILWEAVERVMDPPDINTDSLLLVSVSGFIVNLVGIFAFEHGGHGHSHGGGGGHGHSHGSHSHSKEKSSHGHNDHGHSHSHGHNDHGHSHSHGDHGHSHGHGHENHSNSIPVLVRHDSEYLVDTEYEDVHKNPLMQGMFLHILADTLGSVGVIISSLMLQFFGWRYADPLCSLFIALMILISVFPLLKSSLFTLLQRCPDSLDPALPSCYNMVQKIDGVEGFSDPHFWEHNSTNTVGTIKIMATQRGDEQMIREKVSRIFRKQGSTT